MNTAMLKAVMVQNGDTQTKLAKEMNMVQSALSARINGHVEMRQNEMNFIRKRYNLSDEMTALIFFSEEVSKKDTTKGA